MSIGHSSFMAVLSFVLLIGADSAQALSCGSPSAEHAVNGPDSPATILLGVAVSAEFIDNAGPNSPEIIGELKIVETLRGTSNTTLPFEVRPKDPSWGKPVVHIGRAYLVLQSAKNDGVFKIGLCTRPLLLDASDVTVGDGCKLYRFRELLNIDQPKSHACEVLNRWSGRSNRPSKADREAMLEEFRRAKWMDLGVDWGGADSQ